MFIQSKARICCLHVAFCRVPENAGPASLASCSVHPHKATARGPPYEEPPNLELEDHLQGNHKATPEQATT